MVSPSFSQFSGLPCELINCGKQTDQRMRRQEKKREFQERSMTPAKVPRVKDVSSPNSNSLAFRKKIMQKYFFQIKALLTFLFLKFTRGVL